MPQIELLESGYVIASFLVRPMVVVNYIAINVAIAKKSCPFHWNGRIGIIVKLEYFQYILLIEQPLISIFQIYGYYRKHRTFYYSLLHSESDDKHFGKIFVKTLSTVPIQSRNNASVIVHVQKR